MMGWLWAVWFVLGGCLGAAVTTFYIHRISEDAFLRTGLHLAQAIFADEVQALIDEEDSECRQGIDDLFCHAPVPVEGETDADA